MSFAQDFREHVIPRLQNLATAEAVCVARGVETFSGACSAIWRYANRYGATSLSSPMIDVLDDWILSTLLVEIDKAERHVER